MKLPLFFALACTSSVLTAADRDLDASVLIFGASRHFDAPPESAPYQEFNPGLGLKLTHRTDTPDVAITAQAGYFRNSYDRGSCFAGPGLQIGVGDSYGIHLAALYLTGYDDLPYHFTIMPSAYITVGRYTLHTAYVGEALGFYIEIRF
jgi:hypothetical protein